MQDPSRGTPVFPQMGTNITSSSNELPPGNANIPNVAFGEFEDVLITFLQIK